MEGNNCSRDEGVCELGSVEEASSEYCCLMNSTSRDKNICLGNGVKPTIRFAWSVISNKIHLVVLGDNLSFLFEGICTNVVVPKILR